MAATDAMVGNDVFVYVNVGTEGAPDYQPVAYQTNYSHESERGAIDVSHKLSDHAMTLPGRQTGTMTLSLLALKPGTNDATHAALRNSYDERLPVYVQERSTFPGAAGDGSEDDVYEAEGYITTFSKAAEQEAPVTFEVTITLNERLTLAS
jgi:hypothetical protein